MQPDRLYKPIQSRPFSYFFIPIPLLIPNSQSHPFRPLRPFRLILRFRFTLFVSLALFCHFFLINFIINIFPTFIVLSNKVVQRPNLQQQQQRNTFVLLFYSLPFYSCHSGLDSQRAKTNSLLPIAFEANCCRIRTTLQHPLQILLCNNLELSCHKTIVVQSIYLSK